MATSPLPLLLFFLAVFASTAAARPCKTLFYFSSTTTTYYPNKYNPLSHNPNLPRHLTLVFTSTSTVPDRSLNFDSISDESLPLPSAIPLKFYTSISSSIRDRTRDILSVIGALLFGVGCGALTATTIYFVWALFSPRRFDLDEVSSSSDDDDNGDDVGAIKKKVGYVKVPTNPRVDDDDLKKPAPLTKEERLGK